MFVIVKWGCYIKFITIKCVIIYLKSSMINFVSQQSDQNFKVLWFQIINVFISITLTMDANLWIIKFMG